MTLYNVSAEAQNDLFEIWLHIAQDSVELANRAQPFDTLATEAEADNEEKERL